MSKYLIEELQKLCNIFDLHSGFKIVQKNAAKWAGLSGFFFLQSFRQIDMKTVRYQKLERLFELFLHSINIP